jgi:aminocarboxymuconate-semialdehyde decarboxylase
VLTVDVHTHFAPASVVAAARRGRGFDGITAERSGGQEWLVHRQGFRWPVPAVFYDLPARLAAMDQRGIGHAVLLVAPQLFMYWADATGAAAFAGEVNDELAAFAAGSGGRITAVATLPMQDPAAVAELRRAVAGLGMRGAEIGPDVAGTPLDDPGPRAVLAAAADLGVPLIVHPYYVGARPGLADFYLTNLIGNPLATPVGQGWLRVSHRKLDPDLSAEYRPYHAHDQIQPLVPGEVYQADVEIWPTSLIVPAGYRIALTVRGRDWEVR